MKMLKIKTYCLPEMEQDKLLELHQAIVAVIVKIQELGIKDENGMCNLFPEDLMKYGLGTEIPIEISGIYCTKSVRDKVAREVGTVVKTMFPAANVDCEFIESNPYSAHWSSTRLKKNDCEMHGSIEHMQSAIGLCPGCGKP